MKDSIGKSIERLKTENNFCWYVEFKPKNMFGFDLEEHNKLVEVFIKFLPKENIKILKLNDENVEEVFELNYEEILENIKLLCEGKGKLYDEGDEISYSILTENFLSIIQQGMIFWSSKKELAFEWAEKLKENDLNFFKPSFVGNSVEKMVSNLNKEKE